MEEISYEHSVYETIGAYLRSHLKNRRITKFMQQSIECTSEKREFCFDVELYTEGICWRPVALSNLVLNAR